MFHWLCCGGFWCSQVQDTRYLIADDCCSTLLLARLFPALVGTAIICRAERCGDAPGSTPITSAKTPQAAFLFCALLLPYSRWQQRISSCEMSASNQNVSCRRFSHCTIHYLHAPTLCLPVRLRPARSRTSKWSGGFARRSKLGGGRFSSWTKRHCAPPGGT